MSNFELIDDYLANRLPEQDRISFEQQLAGDPALKEEVQFQQRVIEGVRQARATELKNMLKNVPVNGNTWSAGKISAAAVTVGIIATSIYFYMKDEAPVLPDKTVQESVQPSQESKETVTIQAESKNEEPDNASLPAKENNQNAIISKTPKPVVKPDIQVTDPSMEYTDTERVKDHNTPGRSEIFPSKMEVTTGIPDKKHNFHYQFADSKLLLYGPFDKSLYEILEIHGEGHAVFLFYKENYYLLDEKQAAITSLEPIRDSQLLKKLREYRGR